MKTDQQILSLEAQWRRIEMQIEYAIARGQENKISQLEKRLKKIEAQLRDE